MLGRVSYLCWTWDWYSFYHDRRPGSLSFAEGFAASHFQKLHSSVSISFDPRIWRLPIIRFDVGSANKIETLK